MTGNWLITRNWLHKKSCFLYLILTLKTTRLYLDINVIVMADAIKKYYKFSVSLVKHYVYVFYKLKFVPISRLKMSFQYPS